MCFWSLGMLKSALYYYMASRGKYWYSYFIHAMETSISSGWLDLSLLKINIPRNSIILNFFCLINCRSASLQHVNNMLREQLDQATSANQQLTLDIQKLTADWNKAREELEARDEEEQAYFANEHVRLMDMWKTMNNFRRQFNEMKSATQRCV